MLKIYLEKLNGKFGWKNCVEEFGGKIVWKEWVKNVVENSVEKVVGQIRLKS